MLTPEQSNPVNNPNHPRIRCIDGTNTEADQMVSADEAGAEAPFRVFDILNQVYVGPEFPTRLAATAHMDALGGCWAPSTGRDGHEATVGSTMDSAAAFKVVLDLARQNLIDPRDDREEHERQTLACSLIEAIAANHHCA